MKKEEISTEERVFKARRTVRNRVSPAKFLVFGYAGIILVGTLLLTLPVSTVDGEGLKVVDALFTATSALCVTGLVVVSTANHLSTFGQVTVMILIQIGAVGIMTMSVLFFILLGRKITLQSRLLIRADRNQDYLAGLVRLARAVLSLTLLIEAMGAVIMFLLFLRHYTPARAAYYAVFHSISAFGNAGFDLFGNSLEGFVTDIPVNLVFATLFIIGGLGFTVLFEILETLRGRQRSLSLHTRMVLFSTAALIFSGWVLLLALEHNNPDTMGSLSWPGKMLASFFSAVTPRTAGFNTIPVGRMRDASLLVTMVLMFIGASPGSTGGGVKTTTITTLLAAVYATVLGKNEVAMFRRRIADEQLHRAATIIILAVGLVTFTTLVLFITEGTEPLNLAFEAFSAFGTVGLSTGVTSGLSVVGRIMITFLMFTGRVGPMTLALALGENRPRNVQIRYPEEQVMLG